MKVRVHGTRATAASVASSSSSSPFVFLKAQLGRLLFALLLTAGATSSLQAASVVVDDATDMHHILAGQCSLTGAGPCGLWDAITYLNSQAGSHTITFSVALVTLSADLPIITKPTTIDGIFGAPRVEISGGPTSSFNSFQIAVSAGGVAPGSGSTIKNLNIHNMSGNGVSIVGGGNTVSNCYIGTDKNGVIAMPNKGDGVNVTSPALGPFTLPLDLSGLGPNFIGNPIDPTTGNLISGNNGMGVDIFAERTVLTNVAFNKIGTDFTGNLKIANGSHGVGISGNAFNNTIGPGNIISGNDASSNADGISITGATLLPNIITTNIIGPSSTLLLNLGNGRSGIRIDSTIASQSPFPSASETAEIGPLNIIGYNAEDGVFMTGSGDKVRVFGNFIGIAKDPNNANGFFSLGNKRDGVRASTGNHQIGGASIPETNVISANAFSGVNLNVNAFNVNVQGNIIGRDPFNLVNVGNVNDGILISGVGSNIIGGTNSGEANVIAGNGRNGIKVTSTGNGWANLITRNSIFENNRFFPGLGIDLDVFPDFFDPVDDTPTPDPNLAYSNFGQNTTVIQAGPSTPVYNSSTGQTSVTWTLHTSPNTPVTLEFFASDTPGFTAHGEGQMYLGTVMTVTDGAGNAGATSAITPPSAYNSAGKFATMTVTSTMVFPDPPGPSVTPAPANNTSEFSNAVLILALTTLSTQANPPNAPIGTSVMDLATLASGLNPTGSITFNLFGPGDPTCAAPSIFTSVVPVNGNGPYPSMPFAPSAPGTYNFTASYSGDVGNTPSSSPCGAPNESVVIMPAPTNLTTSASGSVQVNNPVNDTATLSNGVNPTGTITFNLFGPADPTCVGGSVFTAAVPVAGNGMYGSGNFLPVAAGTYNWVAAYSGDANNLPSASPCGSPNESVVVTPVTTTLTTTASATVPVGGMVSDSAALAGGVSPTGTITFNLFGPNDATCATAAVFTAAVPVAGNGNYGSGNFTPTTAGTYRFTAAYSGDGSNPPASSPCNAANESVDVTAAAPTISTAASATVALGGNVSDVATIASGFNPTGTVTFNLFGPNDATCATAAVFTAAVPVAGNGNYNSGNFAPGAAGTFRYTAAYSGDANNTAATSPCNAANESVIVTGAVATTLVTTASATVPIGGNVSDSATLAGGTNPTGTITFNLFGPNDATCATVAVFTAAVPVNGNGVYGSGNFAPTSAGTYRFTAAYSGDAGNAASSSPCNAVNESVVVTTAAPTINTMASPSVVLGGNVSDVATIASGFNPGGTVTFNLFGPNDATCATVAVFTATVPVAGNGNYNSGNFTPVAAGTYRYTAAYSGDANNAAATSPCNAANESVTVTGAIATTLVTTASATVAVGGNVNDSATLAGGTTPTGTITFNLFGPNDATCATVAVFTASVPVNGNGVYGSGNFAPASAGTYRFTAAYSGDATNAGSSSGCNAANESVVVTPAAPTITTTASATVALGGAVSDSATIAGGSNPTGTITFNLFGPNDATCATVAVFTAAIPVAGNGVYGSGNFTPVAAGTYRYTAAYSGDVNNSAATSPCNAANESVIVTPAGAPTLVTTASATVVVGGNVSDSATLAGGTNPTGTITFNLFGPNDATCATAAVFTASVPVAGNGVYGSGNFAPATAGTYRFTAAYSGDVNNAAATSPCNAANESVVVSKATPTLTNSASPSVALGGSISDTATLGGGVNATGSITFTVFGPNNATCSGIPVFTSTVPVNGNGAYGSGNFTPVAAGTYTFIASYSGDVNNNPVVTACADPNAAVIVTAAAAIVPIPTLDGYALALLAMLLAVAGLVMARKSS